jgi:PKD repeat protein
MNFKKYIFGFCLLFNFLNATAQRCTLATLQDCGNIVANGGIAGGTNLIFCDSSVVPVINSSVATGTVIDSTYFCWGDGKDTAVVGTNDASHFYTLKPTDGCSKTFTIRMTVIRRCQDVSGAATRSSHWITTDVIIKRKPKSTFSVAANACEGVTTSLTNTSTCVPNAFKWIFGDGTADSTHYNTTHGWVVAGSYNVRLVSVGCNGTADTASQTVVVHGTPTSSASPTAVSGANANGCSPLTTTFANTSRNVSTFSWNMISVTGTNNWNFNAGSSATSSSPTITFNTTDSSTYRLRLTATSQYCGNATWDTFIKVRARPIVDLLNVPDGCNSLTVRPSQMVSYTGGTPTTYAWAFTNIAPATSTSRFPPDMIYSVGNHAMSVITTNICGSDTAAITFRVTPPPTGTFTGTVNPPNNCVPSTVQLTTTTTNVNSYDWQVISTGNFTYQGGTNRSSANPILQLTSAGNYLIRGTLRGCSDIVKDTTITLIAPPSVDLDSIPNACLPYTVNPGAIVHYSNGTPVSYQWNYTGGSRNSDNVRNPGPVTFDTPGQYGISAAATNVCGTGRDTISFKIDSLPEVSATLLPDLAVYCAPATITFNNNLKYVYSHQWRVNGAGRWRFLSGTTATSPNPVIEFLDEGSYTITLEGVGCITDSWTRTIRVKAKPIVTLDPIANACQTQSVNFQNIVHYSGGAPTTYRWDFKGRNPDSTAALQNPPILTYNPGSYSVMVRTTNECGTSADTSDFTVTPAPVIGTVVTSGNPNGCVPLNIDLQSNTQNAATYQWSVLNGTGGTDYTFEAGTNVNTQNAILRFPNAGSYQVRLNVTGCRSAQWDTTLVLKTAPLVRLATIPTQCAPQTVLPSTLVSYTGGTPTSYLWTYKGANRNSDTVRAPNALIFNRVGFDTISITASNVCGTATDRIVFNLKGGPQPIIAITATDTNYCNPVQLALRSDSSISVTTFRWTAIGATFVNGTTLNSPNPVLSYNAAGTYQIALQADGCSTANWDKTVTVTIPPVVRLSGVPDTCGQLTVDPAALVQYSGGTPTTYTWTFTNMPSPISNLRLPPPVNYTQSGQYSIINRSENKCGFSVDTVRFTIRNPAPITITPIPLVCNTDTTIQLQVNPIGGVWFGTSVTQAGLFNPRTATLGINTLRYNYGVGQCLNTNTTNVEVSGVVIQTGSDTFVCNNAAPLFLRGQSPANGIWSGLGIIDSINGLFNPKLVPAGTHFVTYTIKNAQNRCVNQKTRRVTVYAAPKAAFDSLPLQCVGAPVNFVNRSVRMDSILWVFRHDSSRSNLATATNIYRNVGLDTIKLYVKTLNNCVDSLKRVVDVVEPGIAAFTPSLNIGCGPLLPVRFTNQSRTLAGRDSLYTFIWDFGTGRRDTARNVLDSILFRQANGDKIDTVRLTVSNVCGSHTAMDTIHTRPTPTARFGFQPLGSCSPLEVQFYNASPGYPTRFYWDFGNGNTSRDSAVQRQFFRTDTGAAAARRVFIVNLRVENACGSSTTQDTISVLPPGVNADFTIDTLVGCAPFTVRCSNYSTPGSRVWWRAPKDSLGSVNVTDTLESYEQTLFTNTYNTQGFYKVMLFARSANNCGYDSTFRIIQVLPPAQISISHLPAVCTGDTITLQAVSQNFFFKIWHFGDGDSARQLNARHVYRQPGNYTLTMYGNTLNGNCPVVRTSNVLIRALPQANLSVDRMDGCPPLTVNFGNRSTQAAGTGIPPYASWDFGDRNTANILNPTHRFDSTGNYSIRLRVTDAFGCKDDTLWSQIIVHPVPDANFSVQPANTCGLPMQVQFNNQSTGATGYEWQLGNGLNSTITHPNTSYGTEGIIPVRLIAISNFLCRDTAFGTVQPVQKPSANFSSTPNGCEPLTVRYQDRSTNATGRRLWIFSDGTTDTLLNVNRLYARSGSYVTKLIVSRGTCKDSMQVDNIAYPLPDANFTAVPQNPCGLPMQVQFNNQTTGATSYDWQFGAAGQFGTSNAAQPTNNFPTEGIIPIRLIATTVFGCKDTAFSTVQPVQQPTANFDVLPQNACVPVTVQYRDRSLNATGRRTWIYQDSLRDTVPNPSRLYTIAGTYMTKLIVTNGACKDSLLLPNVVNPLPTARFTVQPTNPCGLPMQAQFTNQSIGAVGYDWLFGVSGTSTAQHPTSTFGTEGVIPIRLIATNAFFCKDTFYGSVRPTRQPTAAFTLSPQRGCEPLQVQFQDRSTNATGRRFWVFGDGSTDTLLNPNHLYMKHGLYTPKLIVSNGACYDSLQLTNTVNVLQNPIADFSVRDSMIPRPTGVMLFTNQSQFAQSYVWDFGDGSGTVSQTSPIHRYNRAAPHQVTLFATAANGCKDTLQKPVNPQFFSGLYVPNVFSPESGSEGIRRFLPKGSMLKTYYAAVYSAYGDLIWESDKLIDGQPVEGWDGTRNGTPLPQDVYVWKIQATFEDGTIWVGMTDVNGRHSTVGTLTLLR